jgi:hypothetical protein
VVEKVEEKPPVEPVVVDEPDAAPDVDEALAEGETDGGTDDASEVVAEAADAASTPAVDEADESDKTPAAVEEKKARADRETDKPNRGQTYTVTLITNPPGAMVYEGGRKIGASPVALVGKGILDVTVKKSGYVTKRQPVPATKDGSYRIALKAAGTKAPIVQDPAPDTKKDDTKKVVKPIVGDELPDDVYGD